MQLSPECREFIVQSVQSAERVHCAERKGQIVYCAAECRVQGVQRVQNMQSVQSVQSAECALCSDQSVGEHGARDRHAGTCRRHTHRHTHRTGLGGNNLW